MALANDESEDYVHIISPVVGESGKTILNDALFISIYVESENTLFLSLKKQMPTFVFEEEEETDEVVELIPLVAATVIEEEAVEEKISLDELEEVKPLTKDEIVMAYQIAEDDLMIIKSDLVMAKNAVSEIPVQTLEATESEEPTQDLTAEQLEATTYLEDITKLYNEAKAEFDKWQTEYNSLFEKDVFEQQEMVVDPEFPYYEHTVSNIETGKYKLIITTLDGEEVDRLEFEVVTEDVIADKIIENVNIFDKIIDSDVFE
jgi:FtsZ-binding cell division protein ZapB